MELLSYSRISSPTRNQSSILFKVLDELSLPPPPPSGYLFSSLSRFFFSPNGLSEYRGKPFDLRELGVPKEPPLSLHSLGSLLYLAPHGKPFWLRHLRHF